MAAKNELIPRTALEKILFSILRTPLELEEGDKLDFKNYFIRNSNDEFIENIPYDVIARHVFIDKISDSSAIDLILATLIDLVERDGQADRIHKEFAKKSLRKIIRHVHLALAQYEFIVANIKEKEADIKNINEQFVVTNNDIKTAIGNMDKVTTDLNETKTKIYSEFVSILAIFTAISFLSMGSLQVLGDLFKDVKDPSSISIGYAMIVGGMYVAIMYVFIVVMFVGMKKVIGNGNSYNFNTGICALVIITIAALVGTGLLILGRVVPGLMIITICSIGLVASFLAIQSSKSDKI